MLIKSVCHHRVCFDNRKNERMRTACCHTTKDASYFLRINFTDHHPRNYQIAKRAADCKHEYARYREPCGNRFWCIASIIQISTESDH